MHQDPEKQEDNHLEDLKNDFSPTSLVAPTTMTEQPLRTHEFWVIPIPRRLQYNPQVPFRFTTLINVIFGFASTTTVANLYYCQPLLVAFADWFDVSYDEVSTIPAITQAGYAFGLLSITPLGDLVRRRPLLLLIPSISTLFTISMALAPNITTLKILSFFLGIFTVTPQILLPFAADLAPEHRRSTALSIVLSGLLLGIIVARALGGVIADISHSWRNVYWMGAGLQMIALVLLYSVLPDWPGKTDINTEINTGKPGIVVERKKKKKLTYLGILWTMAKLSVTEPLLVQCYLIIFSASMVFSTFWVTLTFLLSGSPYNFSTMQIGLFGIIGIFGVLTAPFVGRLLDGLVLWVGTLISISILLVTQGILTGAAGIHIAALIIACFGQDVGMQMQHVSCTARLFGLDPSLRARLNAVYMIWAFIGQVVGSAVGSYVFLHYGWRASAGMALGWVGFMFLVLFARGPHCDRKTWFGWQGGSRWTKQA